MMYKGLTQRLLPAKWKFNFEECIHALTCMLCWLLHQCIDSQFEDLQPLVRDSRSCEERQGSQPSFGIPLRSERFRWGTPSFFLSNPHSSPNTRPHTARRPHCGRWCRSWYRSRTWLPSRTPPILLECLEAPFAEGCRLDLPRCCLVASWIDRSSQLMQTETPKCISKNSSNQYVYCTGKQSWLPVYKDDLDCWILQGKKGLHKILKTTSIDAYEESDVFRQRENFHFPFRSESEDDLLHSNKSTHHYFKNGRFKQVSEFQQETTHFLRETSVD